MSHSCPNLVSNSFLYNPYIPFLICRNFLFTIKNNVCINFDAKLENLEKLHAVFHGVQGQHSVQREH